MLALAAGALMALAAAVDLPPYAAFACGMAFVLLAAIWWRPLEVVAPPVVDVMSPPGPGEGETEAEAEEDGLPTAFARALVEKLPTPLLIVSPTGRVVFANSAAREALPRLEIGAHFASLIRAPAFVEAVGATLSDGAPRGVEFTTHHDRERFFEARMALLPESRVDENDALDEDEGQVIVQIEDRTRTRRAEQLRSDFIANASHELRTPLAAIIGYIETLQNHARNDPAARETFLGIMAREAGRMQRLVDDLMSLSRIEMNEHLRPSEEWSLNQIAADSAATLLPLAKQQGVSLRIEIEATGDRVLGDRDQLSQVFTNLIDNAMKYGGPGATVRIHTPVTAGASAGRVGISVTDTGPGIARQHIHRLTERFYRVNVSQSRNKGGTGLGLAIAKHILNRHEGKLEITSKQGEGSTFTVWLPRRESAELTDDRKSISA